MWGTEKKKLRKAVKWQRLHKSLGPVCFFSVTFRLLQTHFKWNSKHQANYVLAVERKLCFPVSRACRRECPLRRPHNCSSAVVLLLHHSHSPLPWHCRAGEAFRAGGCVWNELFSQCPLSGLQWDYADLRLSVLLSWFKTVLNQETKTAFKGILKEFNIRKGFFFCLVFPSCGNRSQPNLFLASQRTKLC